MRNANLDGLKVQDLNFKPFILKTAPIIETIRLKMRHLQMLHAKDFQNCNAQAIDLSYF